MTMNLADMLCYADIDQLTRIARTYDCGGSHSKNELIQSILSAIWRRESLQSRVEEMNAEELRFLNSLLFDNRTSYSLEELKARAGGTADGQAPQIGPATQPGWTAAGTEEPTPAASARSSRARRKNAPPQADPETAPGDSARQTISRFKRFGWLFSGISQQTRYLYQVPGDVRQRLCEALESRYRLQLDVREEPPAYRDERGLLAEDLAVFLRYVRDHDVPLTTEGVLYKRQLGQVLELMSVEEQLPGKTGWRFGYGRRFRDYPDRFSLLYDYAYEEGWIRENPDRLVVTEAGLNAAEGEELPDPARLYRFWLRLYRGPVANLAALAQWVARLSGSWTTASSLFDALRPIIRPYYYDQEKDVFDRRVLRMMMHLGLIRWGESTDREAVVRVTPQGRSIVAGTSVPDASPDSGAWGLWNV
jgi:hypothetical protein